MAEGRHFIPLGNPGSCSELSQRGRLWHGDPEVTNVQPSDIFCSVGQLIIESE